MVFYLYLLYPLVVVQQQEFAAAVLLLQDQGEMLDPSQRKLFLQRHHDVLTRRERDIFSRKKKKKNCEEQVLERYLDCGAGLKFKGLGLTVLQVHLQDVRQEEQRVPLRMNQQIDQRKLSGSVCFQLFITSSDQSLLILMLSCKEGGFLCPH